MYIKQFESWNKIKEKIEAEKEENGLARICEVRWAHIGVNLGSEIDGKGNSFLRPVLILHTLGKKLCLVAPMSTKIKADVFGYFTINFLGKDISICLNQIKIISTKRIFDRIGKVRESKLSLVKEKLKNIYVL